MKRMVFLDSTMKDLTLIGESTENSDKTLIVSPLQEENSKKQLFFAVHSVPPYERTGLILEQEKVLLLYEFLSSWIKAHSLDKK